MAHFDRELINGVVYPLDQGPQKYEWFMSLVDHQGPSGRYISITVLHSKTGRSNRPRKLELHIELTTLMKIKPPEKVADRYARGLILSPMTWYVDEVDKFGHSTGHDWYFRAKRKGGQFSIEGVYSTATRKGFVQNFTDEETRFSVAKKVERMIEENEHGPAALLTDEQLSVIAG